MTSVRQIGISSHVGRMAVVLTRRQTSFLLISKIPTSLNLSEILDFLEVQNPAKTELRAEFGSQ